MTLPPPMTAYFAADKGDDPDALARVFAPAATVHDEHAVHTGPAEIRAWWAAAKARYRHRAEPLEDARDGDTVTVRARVTGDFPSSPAILTFTFTLSGDRIGRLEIHG